MRRLLRPPTRAYRGLLGSALAPSMPRRETKTPLRLGMTVDIVVARTLAVAERLSAVRT